MALLVMWGSGVRGGRGIDLFVWVVGGVVRLGGGAGGGG